MNLDLNEIQQVVEEFEKDSKAMKKELYKIAWYMRGSLSITESYMLDYTDRTIISEIIKENLDTTKQTNLPFF